MLESSSSGNIMVNDPDKSFYVEFKPKADSSWQERGMPIADTILGFTESMMNLSVNEESKAFEEKKLNTIKRKNECAVITVLDSDEEKETKRDKKRVIAKPVEQILGQSYFRKIKQEPSEYDESLDRFKMVNSRGEEDSKDTFKALDFELPETDISDSLDSTLWMDSSDITLERYESAKQEPGESKSAYFARLRRLARKHFDEEVKRQILEEEKAEAIKALSQFAKGERFLKIFSKVKIELIFNLKQVRNAIEHESIPNHAGTENFTVFRNALQQNIAIQQEATALIEPIQDLVETVLRFTYLMPALVQLTIKCVILVDVIIISAQFVLESIEQ